ncbi:unnamed protein product [Phytomonas sp. Hart1]|nr:unnamed protein product [Phytomonas sp. Hart1]|eukprot:CCW69537.1 unnamed protein product [Phytomonas sp. isolate Hart1]
MKATPVKKEWPDTSNVPDQLKLQNKEQKKTNGDNRPRFSRDRYIQKMQPNFSQQPMDSITDRAQSCRNRNVISNLRSKRGLSDRFSPRPLHPRHPDRFINTNATGHPLSRRKNKLNNTSRLNTHRSTIAPDRILRSQSRQIHHTPSDPFNNNTSCDVSSSTIQIICSTSKSSLMNTSRYNSIDLTDTFSASSPRHQRLTGVSTHFLSDEILQEHLTSFIRHLPSAWMFPILRAATLQVMTERLPMHIVSSSIIFDAYSEAKAELVQVLKNVDVPIGNAVMHLTKLAPNNQTSAPEGAKGPQIGTSGEVTTHPISANTSIRPFDSHLGNSDGLVDLVGLQLVVPAILRFRLDHIKQSRIQEFINQCDQNFQSCKEQNTTAPIREAAALQLFYDQDSDIQFGAHLRQGVRRSMKRGSRLLLPYYKGDPTTDAESNDSMTITSCAAVSFSNMPSIFLKAREESNALKAQQTKGDANIRGNNRRHRVHPFFTCEFAATLTCGSDGGCIFASALATEFLVGMPSFISQPMNCIASAIRATLHRMCLGVTKESLRRFSGQAVEQLRGLRMPPLDLALLYVRGSQLYYGSTTGIKGKFFFFNNDDKEGSSFDLCKDYLLENVGVSSFSTRKVNECHNTVPFDNPSSTGNATSLAVSEDSRDNVVPKGASYDMPIVVRGFVDLSRFVSLNTVPATSPREHGLDSKDTLNTVGLNRLMKKLARPSPLRSQIVFPLAVVLSCSEFWSVMSTTYAVNLLRTLLLLDYEASSYTERLRFKEKSNIDEIEFTEEFMETERASSLHKNIEGTMVIQQSERIREYLNTLDSKLSPDVRARMTAFYDNRVAYHIQISKFSKFDSSRIYTEELRAMANERRKKGEPQNFDPPPSLINDNTQDSNFATGISRIKVGAPSHDGGHDSEIPIDTVQVKRQGPTAWSEFHRASTRVAADGQPLCDALASFLATEASIICHKSSQDLPNGDHFVRDQDMLPVTASIPISQTLSSVNYVAIPLSTDNAIPVSSSKSNNIINENIPHDAPEMSNLDDFHTLSEASTNARATFSIEGSESGEPYSVVVVLLPADIVFADAGRRSRGLNVINHARRSHSQKQPK